MNSILTYGGAHYVSPNENTILKDNENIIAELLNLDWETKRTARHEYFMSLTPREYSYGNRAETTPVKYNSKPFSPIVEEIMKELNEDLHTELNVCFLNKYDDQHQHLGWHADEFPGMREDQPIIVFSYGAEREIWLKDKRGFECSCVGNKTDACKTCEGTGWLKSPISGKQPETQRVKLEEGSIFIMPPGYQASHVHRIPKHSCPSSWRISLTFRSFQ